MDLRINKKIYKKKKINSVYTSVWFLILIIILTSVLYLYNSNLIKDNNNLDTLISKQKSAINNLEKDPNIVVSSLYNYSKNSIERLEDYSKISYYINHLIKLRWIYGIDFIWFKYSSWKLSTTAVASSELSWNINYKKTAKFIKEYRENEDLTWLFDLGMVNSVITKNKIDNIFNINLILKNNILKILENIEIKKIEEKKINDIKLKEKREQLEKAKEVLLNSQKEKTDNTSWTIVQ